MASEALGPGVEDKILLRGGLEGARGRTTTISLEIGEGVG